MRFSFQRLGCYWTPARAFAVVLLAALAMGRAAYASEGILLLGDDPIRVGRAGAAVASPGNASTITLNPAGMVDLERRVDFNMSVIHYRLALRTKSIAQIPFAGEMTDHELQGLPSVGIVWPREDGALGLSLHVPVGAMVHFPRPRTWVGILEGGTDRNLDFAQPRLTLAYAHKFDSEWAVGVSLSGSISAGRTDQMTRLLLPTRGNNEWDYAFGAGAGIGVYRAGKRWSFGAAVESRQWSQVFDKYRDISSYAVDLPATAQTGFAYRITPALQVELDYRFINWSDVKFFHEDNAHQGLGWRDQHGVMCGIEWQATRRWTFRAGYSRMTPAVDGDHVFGTALAPLMVTDHVAAGFTRVLNDRSELHVTLAHWFERQQTDTGAGDVYSHLGKGSQSSVRAEWLTLGYSLKF